MKKKGLTLIELLVALAIAAFIGGSLLGLLLGVTRSKSFSETVSTENQIIRGIFDLLYSDLRCSFQTKRGLNFVGEKNRLSFLKMGIHSLERVEYEFKDGELKRNDETVFKDKNFSISFRFFEKGRWLSSWKRAGAKPDAVEVEVKYGKDIFKMLILTH